MASGVYIISCVGECTLLRILFEYRYICYVRRLYEKVPSCAKKNETKRRKVNWEAHQQLLNYSLGTRFGHLPGKKIGVALGTKDTWRVATLPVLTELDR